MALSTIADSTGWLGADLIYRKNAKTNTSVPDDYYHQYARQILKNPWSEAPLFEHERSRHRVASTDRLSLRECGRRSCKEPWLPDGTFLDFDGLAPDPRSCMPGPDFSRYVGDCKHRAHNYTKKLDTDACPMEIDGCVHPAQMESDIKATMPRFKNAFRNFSTSLAGWPSGTGLKPYATNNNIKFGAVTSSTVNAIQGSVAGVRGYDATTQLSNMSQVGWDSVPDHRFMVSSYGVVRPDMAPGATDPTKNRKSAVVDYDVPVQIESDNIPAPALETMKTRIEQRRAQMDEASRLLPEEYGLDAENRSLGLHTDIGPTRFNARVQVHDSEPVVTDVKKGVMDSEPMTVSNAPTVTGLRGGSVEGGVHSIGSMRKKVRHYQSHDMGLSNLNDMTHK